MMKFKTIAKVTTKSAAGMGAYAVTSNIIDKTMPEPQNVVEKTKFTIGQVSLSMGASYLAQTAVEKQFDELWDAASEIKSTIKNASKKHKSN